MKSPNRPDDPFTNSLKRLSPQISRGEKSRLLYECGVAATEMKYRRQAKRYCQIASMAVLLAAVAGVFVGRFASPIQSPPVADSLPVANQHRATAARELTSPMPSPTRSPGSWKNGSTLAVAMPMDKCLELLAHKNVSDPADKTEVVSLTVEPSLSMRALMDELDAF